MNRLSVLFLSAALALGCGGGSSETTDESETTETTGGEASASGDACVAFFTRQRECGEEFIPALVALRVRLDRPAGIAAQDGSGGRDALVAQARTEYESDSTDEAIAAECQGIMSSADAAQAAEAFAACTAQAECSAFIECDLAMLQQHWASEDAAAGAE